MSTLKKNVMAELDVNVPWGNHGNNLAVGTIFFFGGGEEKPWHFQSNAQLFKKKV